MDLDGDHLDSLDAEAGLRRQQPAADAEFRLNAEDVTLLRSLGIDPTRRAPRRPSTPLHVDPPRRIKAKLRPARRPSAADRR